MYIHDFEYLNIVEDILENEQFKQLENIRHHGCNRYLHSLRVSYYSYRLAKRLGLDYRKTARGGLLHDFFYNKHGRNSFKGIIANFNHPTYALENSIKYFNVSEKEQNIIKAHMFPLLLYLPRYTESWLVSLVDKVVATREWAQLFGYKVRYATNLFLIFIINTIR